MFLSTNGLLSGPVRHCIYKSLGVKVHLFWQCLVTPSKKADGHKKSATSVSQLMQARLQAIAVFVLLWYRGRNSHYVGYALFTGARRTDEFAFSSHTIP